LLMVSRKCHCWWILRGCLPKALLITHPIDIEVTNAIQGLNSRKNSMEDKIDKKNRHLYFNHVPLI
jgi:adenylosuccinate lyase